MLWATAIGLCKGTIGGAKMFWKFLMNTNWKQKIGVVIATILIGFWGFYGFMSEELVINVNKTEKVIDAVHGTSVYRVSSYNLTDEKAEVFVNKDSLAYFKWNSADVDNILSPYGLFKVRVWGVRFVYMSWFRNVISATPFPGIKPLTAQAN